MLNSHGCRLWRWLLCCRKCDREAISCSRCTGTFAKNCHQHRNCLLSGILSYSSCCCSLPSKHTVIFFQKFVCVNDDDDHNDVAVNQSINQSKYISIAPLRLVVSLVANFLSVWLKTWVYQSYCGCIWQRDGHVVWVTSSHIFTLTLAFLFFVV